MSGYNGSKNTIWRHLIALAGTAVLLTGLLAAVPANAGESCNCVANGQRVELGRLFCIKTASGREFLARCERVLNNTSWTRIQDGCPTALKPSAAQEEPLL